MKMRKAISAALVFLCILTLFCVFALGASAEEPKTVYATTSATVKQGGYAYTYVYIDDMTDLASMTVAVHYDPERVEVKGVYNRVTCDLYDSSSEAGCVQFSYIFDGEGKAGKTNLFYIYYKALDTAECGDAYFDVVVSDAYSSSLEPMDVVGSRVKFSITEKSVTTSASINAASKLTTAVGEELTLSYRLSTYRIASGSFEITYDHELFELVSLTAGGFLNGKISDVNTELSGAASVSFVGTEYGSKYDLVTLKLRAKKNVDATSDVKLTIRELYDLDLNLISSSGYSTSVTVTYDETYAEDSPAVRLETSYDAEGDRLSVKVLLDEGSCLGAGDFALGFDTAYLTYVSSEKGFSPNFFNVNEKNVESGALKFSVISLTDVNEAETLLTVVFDVNHACEDKITDLVISGSGLTDSMTEPIVLNFVDASAEVPFAHSFGEWEITVPAGETESGMRERSCACGEKETEVIPPTARISTSLTLGSDLSLNAYVNLTDADGITARFTMNGKTTEAVGEYVSSVGLWRYVFEGVTPIHMGDGITIELVKDGAMFASVEDYSIKGYCLTVMSMTASQLGLSEAKYAAIKTLAADLLDYGAAAQIYMNYKTDSLVNEGIEGSSEFESLTSTDMKLTKYKTVTGVKFTAATLHFNNANRLCFKFTVPDVSLVKIRITYGSKVYEYTAEHFALKDGVYALYTPDIYATAFDRIYYATLIYDGEEIQMATYSVRSYVYSKQNDSDAAVRDLVRATYKYGISAKAYATAK